MNSVRYGLSNSYQMALSESLEVQASHLTTILAEEGPPPEIEEEKKFVLKSALDYVEICVYHNLHG